MHDVRDLSGDIGRIQRCRAGFRKPSFRYELQGKELSMLNKTVWLYILRLCNKAYFVAYSCMRRIRTYLRCTMRAERLSGLAILLTYKDTSVDTYKVVQGRFPFNKNSGLKFLKLHVLNGTVHSSCTDPTQATARFVIVASQHTHNDALKEKSKYCLYPKELKGAGILFRVESLSMQVKVKNSSLWIEAMRFSEYSKNSKQFLELYGK